jgi:hypothetical protein
VKNNNIKNIDANISLYFILSFIKIKKREGSKIDIYASSKTKFKEVCKL